MTHENTADHAPDCFLKTADSRHTSWTLMRAILEVAKSNEDMAACIWEKPTKKEIRQIIATLRKWGMVSKNLSWGSHGTSWKDMLSNANP